eukprot:1025361-Alexandrium_andersonii.AAC.1
MARRLDKCVKQKWHWKATDTSQLDRHTDGCSDISSGTAPPEVMTCGCVTGSFGGMHSLCRQNS